MKTHRILTRFTLSSVLFIVLCREAPAIEFTETSDFSGTLGSPAQITPALETGINKIYGSVPEDFGMRDIDVFEVQLPFDLTILSISIQVSNFVPAGSEQGRFEILFAADGNTGAVDIPSDGTFDLPFNLGDPSRIAFRVFGPEDFETFTAGSFDYTVNIAVPEPSTYTLLAMTAAGALWWARRRR
jgi:hypothetical protein